MSQFIFNHVEIGKRCYDDFKTSFDFIVNFVNFPLTLSRPGFFCHVGLGWGGEGGGGEVGVWDSAPSITLREYKRYDIETRRRDSTSTKVSLDVHNEK